MHFSQRPIRWQALVLLVLLALGPVPAPGAEDAVEARMRKDVTFLASDECEGRGVTTKGINLAADHIASEFKKAGLKPAGPDGSYFQPFTMTGAAKLDSPNKLVLRGPQGKEIELKLNEGFLPVGLSAAGKVTAPVVFAGYGITAKDVAYDDYNGVDVAGKVVVILRKTPQAGNTKTPFAGKDNLHHAALATKMVNAEGHKAAAVIFVNDRDSAKEKDQLMSFGYTASASAPTKLPAVHVQRGSVDTLLKTGLDTDLRAAEDKIDKNLKPQSGLLEGWTATVEVNVSRPTIPVKNVVGVAEGAGPLANETVVIGAHYDHLGFGGVSSLALNRKPAIHHGADDNASGTTTLLEVARRFGAMDRREGRRLVFIAFSAEESGLLGSEHYCKKPLFPLKETAAMVNMDMVGRLSPEKASLQTFLAMLTPPAAQPVPVVPLAASEKVQRDHLAPAKDRLIVYGTGTAKHFNGLIDSLTKDRNFKLEKVPGGTGPSDHASFYAKEIPVFFFFTGDHKDYHRPSDTADKINVRGMRRIADLVEEVAGHLAREAERPQFVKVAGGTSSSPGFRGPRIGIRPSYGDDKEGVLVSGVVEGGPAAKAGLKEGDRIMEVGGKQVKNLESYMVLIAGHKKGEPLEVGVLRDGKKATFKVNPEY